MTRTTKTRTVSLALAAALALCLILPGAAATSEGLTAQVTIGTGIQKKPSAEVEVQWDDAWFAGDAGEYRRGLAAAAMALSASAYAEAGKTPGIQKALKDLGFERVRSYNYQLAAVSVDRAAYTFGLKTVKDGDGKDVKLTAVVIRGTGTYTEWAGNLNVGEGRDHAGFAGAADDLLAGLKRYLSQAGIGESAQSGVKFLLTGHSRGGAAANLAAARLTDAGADVYAYTFASPAVSLDGAEEGYENIFNIIREDDLVTQVPLAKWGYHRYGTDLPLPQEDGSEDYDAVFAKMEAQYKKLTGEDYVLYQDPDAVEEMTATLLQLAPAGEEVNMAMLSALLTGDLEGLRELVDQDPTGAVLLGRTALELSAGLTPMLQQERGALTSAHCMAGYYCWVLSAGQTRA